MVHHIELMRALGEVRFGIFDRALIESALARPRHAAVYDQADLPAQAASLCFGLIKDHPWVGGNKRTGTHLTDHFLKINGFEIRAAPAAIVEMVEGVEADRLDITTVSRWMSEHVHHLL